MSGYYWSLPKPSGGSWDEIVFPIHFLEIPRETGWFAACQFYFDGSDNGGYIGLQPRPGQIMETRFSVFGAGARVVDTGRCHAGADGGAGVTCDGGRYNVGPYSWYYLKVARRSPGSRIWEGTMYDENRQNPAPLGAWELSHDGGLHTEGPGFLERYRHCECNQLPRIVVDFGRPANWPTGLRGKSFNPHHNGYCTPAQENFLAEEWDLSARIGSGWTGATCGDKLQPINDAPRRPCGCGDVNVDVNVTVDGAR